MSVAKNTKYLHEECIELVVVHGVQLERRRVVIFDITKTPNVRSHEYYPETGQVG